MAEFERRADRLQQHYQEFINEYRRQYDNLTDKEKRRITNASNYLRPTQVEVFWLEEPETQFVVVTHFAGIADAEVTVNGPWKSYDFIKNIETVLSASDKWKKELVILNFSEILSYNGTYGEYLAQRLYGVVQVAKETLFAPKAQQWFGRPSGMFFPEQNWTEIFEGFDISKLDPIERVNQLMTEIRAQAKLHEEQNDTSTPQRIVNPPYRPEGYGSYFFPPIALKQRKKPSLDEILHGINPNSRHSLLSEYATIVKFAQTNVMFNEEGFISVATTKRKEAISILNTIMGMATILGLEMYAVRDHELIANQYEPESLRIVSYSYRINTLRTMQHDVNLDDIFGLDFRPRHISREKLTDTITKAAKIYPDEIIADHVRILGNAFTHLQDSEYPQSFITSWSIIERWISSIWKNKVASKEGLSKDREGKLLKNNTYLTTDHKMEILNLEGAISDEQYSQIDKLKAKRNGFIHNNQPVEMQDAVSCYNFANKLVLSLLEKYRL